MSTKKFRDLVQYIIYRSEDPTQLGAVKLNKIAWFVDSLAYRRDGESVTGETYIKKPYGPVPRHIDSVLAELERESKIARRDAPDFQPREFVGLTQPDVSSFTDRELQLIDTVMDNICKGHTATSISDLSHDQVWQAAAMGEEIPLYAVLAATPGEVSDQDRTWADGILEEMGLEAAAQ